MAAVNHASWLKPLRWPRAWLGLWGLAILTIIVVCLMPPPPLPPLPDNSDKVEHLLVIAAPKTMGQLRKGWHKETAARVVGEISKDLTGHSAEQIAAAIDKA